MKQVRIPLYRTFTNWVIIIVTGSILLPFVSVLLGGNGTFRSVDFMDDDMYGMIAISAIASGFFSIPALIVMFIAHLILNRNSKSFKIHQLVQNGVHLFAAIVTFTIMGILFGPGEQDFLVAIILAYVPVGILVWNITYMLYKKKKDVRMINSDVLDEA